MKKTIVYCIITFAVGVLCGWMIWGAFSTNELVYECANGATPDEHGCCAGEEFTMVNDIPACCPDDGDCFEPIK